MEWEIAKAEVGPSFITTDSHVSFYNPACPPPTEAGIGLAGTIVFFPLSAAIERPKEMVHLPIPPGPVMVDVRTPEIDPGSDILALQ